GVRLIALRADRQIRHRYWSSPATKPRLYRDPLLCAHTASQCDKCRVTVVRDLPLLRRTAHTNPPESLPSGDWCRLVLLARAPERRTYQSRTSFRPEYHFGMRSRKCCHNPKLSCFGPA